MSSYYYWDHFKNKTYSDNYLMPYVEKRSGSSIDAVLCLDYVVRDGDEEESAEEYVYNDVKSNKIIENNSDSEEKQDVPAAKIRKNFNETAFFYPNSSRRNQF